MAASPGGDWRVSVNAASTRWPARNLAQEKDFLGTIRRGEHVTVLYRVRSTKKAGEWLGRLVLGYEKGEVKIFGASVF